MPRTRNRFTSQEKWPSCGFTSSNTPRSRTCVTSTASTPRCSTAGRRNSSKTPRPRSSPVPDVPAMPTGGSPCWSEAPAQEPSPLQLMEEHIKLKDLGTLNGAWFPSPSAMRSSSSSTTVAHRFAGLAVAAMAGVAAASSTAGSAAGGTQPAQRRIPRDFWLELGEGRSSPSTTSIPWRAIAAWRTYARCRRRGRQPLQRLPRAQGGRQARPSRRTPSRKGKGFEQPLPARALARRCVLPQHLRDLLLPVQHPRRLQPIRRPLGDPRDDDEPSGDDHPASSRAYPGEHPRIITDNGPQFVARDFRSSSASAG